MSPEHGDIKIERTRGRNWTCGWQPTTMTSADIRGISGTLTMQPAKHVSPARHVVSGRTQKNQKAITEKENKPPLSSRERHGYYFSP